MCYLWAVSLFRIWIRHQTTNFLNFQRIDPLRHVHLLRRPHKFHSDVPFFYRYLYCWLISG